MYSFLALVAGLKLSMEMLKIGCCCSCLCFKKDFLIEFVDDIEEIYFLLKHVGVFDIFVLQILSRNVDHVKITELLKEYIVQMRKNCIPEVKIGGE